MSVKPSTAPPTSPEERDSGVQMQWIGKTLGGTYRILGVLDQGGMGAVFAAEHIRLRRRVAVKVLAQHLASNSQALGRFHSEAEIISQLQHPHIVHVLDFDATDAGEPYLVMELLQGESLSTRLERVRALPVADVVQIVMQAASGLAAAHGAGVVHRDLKPGNIFLVQLPDQPAFVKLLDFGISKRTGAARGLTGEFDILGTPEYMTPEQALGKTALVDHRGDQYSLAIIAYEALSGAPPLSGDSIMEILGKVIGEAPPALYEVAPQVPREADAVLQRALAKDPEARFASIGDFAAAFAAACGRAVEPRGRASLPTAHTVPAMQSPLAQTGKVAVTENSRTRPTDSQTRTRNEPASSNPSMEVATALGDARDALESGNLDFAVELAETALKIAEATENAGAKGRIERAAGLFEKIFLARLGDLDARLFVRQMPKNNAPLSPGQAFILSRLDGNITVDELLDMCPMPRHQALRLLVSLLRGGMVNFV